MKNKKLMVKVYENKIEYEYDFPLNSPSAIFSKGKSEGFRNVTGQKFKSGK